MNEPFFTFLASLTFANPLFLGLLAGLPIWAAWRIRQRNRPHKLVKIPNLSASLPATWRTRGRFWVPFGLRFFALSLLIVVMARPQKLLLEEKNTADGIDIMLIMDVSSSMLAQDFVPNRLAATQEVAADFVRKRPFDRIGLVVFAGEAFTQCPLTTDHAVLIDFLKNLRCGDLEDGTAIGMGLATGVNRLKESPTKSKILILLTDGVNNSGYVQPAVAANIAKNFDLKIYTIGTGSEGTALTPVGRRGDGVYIFGMAQVEIDEPLLTKIAADTGGKYFRAASKTELENIYSEIDRLEKTKIETTIFRKFSDQFRPFLAVAFILLLAEFLLKNTVFRSLT